MKLSEKSTRIKIAMAILCFLGFYMISFKDPNMSSIPFYDLRSTFSGDVVKVKLSDLESKFNASPNRVLSEDGTKEAFKISDERNSRVNYTINFDFVQYPVQFKSAVCLDYTTDGGMNWTSVSEVSTNSDSGLVLSGEIPKKAIVRIYKSKFENCTITISKQQEVTYN